MLFGISLANIIPILIIAVCVYFMLKVTAKLVKVVAFIAIVASVAAMFGYI